MDEVAQEFDRTTALIRASEEWSDDYKDDPEAFAKLLKGEAKMQRTFMGYLKDLAERAPGFIDWGSYLNQVAKRKAVQADSTEDDFSIDVVIDDGAIGQEDNIVLSLTYDQIQTFVIVGAGAAATVYSRDLGTAELTKTVTAKARELTANLVGKRVDKDGNIIDNPDAKYRISDETRNEIRESMQTSLNLGEDQATATERLTKTLKNAARAELVAQTEAVNGYQGGMFAYAKAAGATRKESQYLGPTTTYNRKTKKYVTAKADLCGTNAEAGPIPIDQPYPSGHQHPAFHPRCRCGEKFYFDNE
jgi:hypothetical protein